MRSASARRMAWLGLAVLMAVFVALGSWQVERRAWKLALIDRVEHRIAADPVPAPDAGVSLDRLAVDWEYRRVSVAGRYIDVADTCVQAVTEMGAGFWVLSPLQRPNGEMVLINRGFVAARPAAAPPTGPQTVVGLLRRSEPRGGFLRRNEPAAGRWFSRDVEAIGAARALGRVAPYFLDAGADSGHAGPGGRSSDGQERAAVSDPAAAADPNGGTGTGTGAGTGTGTGAGAGAGTSTGLVTAAGATPVGGLTVVRFSNSHLVYAVTWYALALLCIVAMVALAREDRRPAARPAPEAGG